MDSVDDEFLVLHALRMKGIAGPDAIEAAWGVDGAESCLSRLADEGLCQFRDLPRGAGYLLLPPGRERHAELLCALREEVGDEAHTALAGVYDRFMPLNDDFKALCEKWQMRAGALNDHSDHDYDGARIAELEDLHARFLPLVMRAGRAVGHFTAYPPRFKNALEKLTDDGDPDYFTKPLMDSYHTVWFEFHEDLIATLGRERQAHEA